ncbi:MAG: RNA pseudouridine synthase [Treponema sp.]|jgi:23S rRNA pseudouridine1911/1915/1917 synthase|nr:RNA pseudouridine synthase [Treponema sp.]
MTAYRPLGDSPRVVDETESYAVLYKPPLMFSAPLDRKNDRDTLLDWYAERCPAVLVPRGRKAIEGGLLHRLDFETEGLILVAKTQGALESLRAQQEDGKISKEYGALSLKTPSGSTALPGFPPPPQDRDGAGDGPTGLIESFFRPWGPGRRAVRPVLQAGGEAAGRVYRTELIAFRDLDGPSGRIVRAQGEGEAPVESLTEFPPEIPMRLFTLRICRGFRHQIRCHLAWIGFPILHDALYGGGDPRSRNHPASLDHPASQDGGEPCPIALRAQALRFIDPAAGEPRDCRLPSLPDLA